VLEKPSSIVPAVAALERSPGSRTLRAYATDFHAFESWCRNRRRTALPATTETVASYLAWLADHGRKIPTVKRALASIAHAHRTHGYGWGMPNLLKKTLVCIRRQSGAPSKKSPITDTTLRAMVGTCGSDLRGLRDRAILTVGWAGALRRSEIAGLDVADIAFTGDTLVVTLRKGSKSLALAADPTICPVRSLRAWLDAAGITRGPLFRAISRSGRTRTVALSDKSVANLVKSAAESLGLDPTIFGGQSLRTSRSVASILGLTSRKDS